MTDSEGARFELLLEDIQDKISLVAEGHGQLASGITRVEGRLGRIERDVGVLKADVAVLKDDVADIKPRVNRIEKHLKLNGHAPKSSARGKRIPKRS